MSTVKEGLFYASTHEWVKIDGNYAYVGISDYAQLALGNIVYVDMPEVDDKIEKGEEFGAVESVKAASDLVSPITGVIVEINKKLEDKPELLNEDAYANWIIKVHITDSAEVCSMMDYNAYTEFCEKSE